MATLNTTSTPPTHIPTSGEHLTGQNKTLSHLRLSGENMTTPKYSKVRYILMKRCLHHLTKIVTPLNWSYLSLTFYIQVVLEWF